MILALNAVLFSLNGEIFPLETIFVVLLCFESKKNSDAEIVADDKGVHQGHDHGSRECVSCVKWHGIADFGRV